MSRPGAGQLSAGDRKVFSLVILTIQIGLSCGTLDHRRRQIQGQSVLFLQGHPSQFTLLCSSYSQHDKQGGASFCIRQFSSTKYQANNMKGCVINWTRRLHSARRVRARVSTPQPQPNNPHPHPHAALQHCTAAPLTLQEVSHKHGNTGNCQYENSSLGLTRPLSVVTDRTWCTVLASLVTAECNDLAGVPCTMFSLRSQVSLCWCHVLPPPSLGTD